jgi:hypothetical protein
VNRLLGFQGAERFLSRIFNRRVGTALLWSLLAAGVAAAVSVAGVRALGGIEGWERWLRANATYFFVWRLMLYAALAIGWRQVRRRLKRHEADSETHFRLRRAEIAAVLALVALEAGQWLQRSQW